MDAKQKLDRGEIEKTIFKVVKCSLDFAGPEGAKRICN